MKDHDASARILGAYGRAWIAVGIAVAIVVGSLVLLLETDRPKDGGFWLGWSAVVAVSGAVAAGLAHRRRR